MDKIFIKTLKTLIKPSKPSRSEVFFKNWDQTSLILWWETLWGKKIEKTDDPKILHCTQMEKKIKPNWKETYAKVGVQLIFAPHRQYRLSIAVWWYIREDFRWYYLYHKTWYIFFLLCLMDIVWFDGIYPASLEKQQFGANAV